MAVGGVRATIAAIPHPNAARHCCVIFLQGVLSCIDPPDISMQSIPAIAVAIGVALPPSGATANAVD